MSSPVLEIRSSTLLMLARFMIAYNAMIVVNFEDFGRVKSQYEKFFEILKLCDSFSIGAGQNETVTMNLFVEHYLVKI